MVVELRALEKVVRVLVTGATGFVGRQVFQPLRSLDAEIHATARARGAAEGVEWHEADLLVPGAARALIERIRPTHLLHLAWYAVPGNFWQSRENFRWIGATTELLEAFADSGGRRFVGTGTCAEYEWSSTDALVEGTTALNPATLYGASKLAVWHLLRTYAATANISCAWGRLFFMYGPHEPPKKLIASVIMSLLQGETAACTSGEQERDFLHVSDLASALVALLASDVNGAVNIGSGGAIAVRDVVLQIGDLLGKRDAIELGAIQSASAEAPRVVADTRRLNEEVGWRPRLSLREGLQETIEWWRDELAR